MLTLIYGTNQIAIRNFILKTAQNIKAGEIHEYSANMDSVGAVEATLQGNIFGGVNLNVIDITGVSKDQTESLLARIKPFSDAHVVLVSARDLEATSPAVKLVRSERGRVIVASGARRNEIFKFLDDLFNRRETACFLTLQKLLVSDADPIYLVAMLQYQTRLVALAKFGLTGKLTPYRASQARKQAENFSEDAVFKLYEMLFLADADIKTGRLNPEVTPALLTYKILYQ